MVGQSNAERTHVAVSLTWMDAARLRTVVKGMTLPAVEYKNRASIKSTRKMSPSGYVEKILLEHIRGVKPDKDSLDWMIEGRARAIARRKEQDERVRKGENRKPKDEWEKCGRVAGKSYPKYDAAMKRLAEKRRSSHK